MYESVFILIHRFTRLSVWYTSEGSSPNRLKTLKDPVCTEVEIYISYKLPRAAAGHALRCLCNPNFWKVRLRLSDSSSPSRLAPRHPLSSSHSVFFAAFSPVHSNGHPAHSSKMSTSGLKAIAPVPKASDFLDIVLSKTQRKTPTVRFQSLWRICGRRTYVIRRSSTRTSRSVGSATFICARSSSHKILLTKSSVQSLRSSPLSTYVLSIISSARAGILCFETQHGHPHGSYRQFAHLLAGSSPLPFVPPQCSV